VWKIRALERELERQAGEEEELQGWTALASRARGRSASRRGLRGASAAPGDHAGNDTSDEIDVRAARHGHPAAQRRTRAHDARRRAARAGDGTE